MADPTAQDEWNAVAAERDTGTTPAAAAVETAPVETAAPTPEVVETAPETPADPYAAFDPATQAKLRSFDALASSFPQFERTLKETAGRVSSLQSDFARSRQAQPAGEAPSSKQVAAAVKDPEKWSSLKKDFPEWGEGIEAFVDARVGALSGSGMTAEQLEQAIATGVEGRTAEIAQGFQRDLIATRYRNWDSIVKTPEFEQWFAAQPPEVKQLAASTRGVDAIDMLDQFHAAKKAPAVRQTRQQTLAAAVTTKTGHAQPTTTKSFAELAPKDQWNEVARERAARAT